MLDAFDKNQYNTTCSCVDCKYVMYWKIEYSFNFQPGEMTERLKVHAWKACVRETVPRVRIPLSPPFKTHRNKRFFYFCFSVGPQMPGPAQWEPVNQVRSGRKQP